MRGLVALGALAACSHALTRTPTSFVESARATLAAWSLEDAKLRRKVQKGLRRVDLKGEEGAKVELKRAQRFFGAVLDEEEYRATKIVEARGTKIVRPADAPADVRGPLGDAEAFLADLEFEALVAGLAAAARGALENARSEFSAVWASEEARSKRAESVGEAQRPLDAPPSLLGAAEGFVDALFREERARLKTGGRFVDVPARDRGPLADLERRLEARLDVVRAYEESRVAILRENRPMDVDPGSRAGRTEAWLAGLARGPLLLRATILRIAALFDAAVLPNEYDPALDDDGGDAAFEAALKRRRP